MKLFLFDMDGTIVDTHKGVVFSIEYVARSLNLILPSSDKIQYVIGLSIPDAVRILFPDVSNAQYEIIEHVLQGQDLKEVMTHSSYERVYEGMLDLIYQLSKKEDNVLGIATGRSGSSCLNFLQRYGLLKYFLTIQNASTAAGKPSPEMIFNAMKQTGCSPLQTYMIGDTIFDMQMANAAGAKGLAITWGYHPKDRLQTMNPHEIISSVKDLSCYLNTL